MISMKDAKKIVRLGEERNALRNRLIQLNRRREGVSGEMVFKFQDQSGNWQAEKLRNDAVVLGYVRRELELQIAALERELRGMDAEITP